MNLSPPQTGTTRASAGAVIITVIHSLVTPTNAGARPHIPYVVRETREDDVSPRRRRLL